MAHLGVKLEPDTVFGLVSGSHTVFMAAESPDEVRGEWNTNRICVTLVIDANHTELLVPASHKGSTASITSFSCDPCSFALQARAWVRAIHEAWVHCFKHTLRGTDVKDQVG